MGIAGVILALGGVGLIAIGNSDRAGARKIEAGVRELYLKAGKASGEATEAVRGMDRTTRVIVSVVGIVLLLGGLALVIAAKA